MFVMNITQLVFEIDSQIESLKKARDILAGSTIHIAKAKQAKRKYTRRIVTEIPKKRVFSFPSKSVKKSAPAKKAPSKSAKKQTVSADQKTE
jgi:hypothetical protein